jgi:hypothetical protein
MATTPDPQDPEIDNPAPVPPVIEPNDDPVPDLHDDPPPEITNFSQDEDESEQAQSVADEEMDGEDDELGLSDTTKVGTGEVDDDVPDLVDHMREMVTSGRIDMGAYRGERNDDDEEDGLGPDGAHE